MKTISNNKITTFSTIIVRYIYNRAYFDWSVFKSLRLNSQKNHYARIFLPFLYSVCAWRSIRIHIHSVGACAIIQHPKIVWIWTWNLNLSEFKDVKISFTWSFYPQVLNLKLLTFAIYTFGKCFQKNFFELKSTWLYDIESKQCQT